MGIEQATENLLDVTAKKAKLNLIPGTPYAGGDAATPPMGWSSWNTFRNRINESLILETAEAMLKSGLTAYGYNRVNIDDCWQSSQRDANGRLQPDFGTFPSGIPALVRKVNALGIKLGIYSSNGQFTCESLPASQGNELLDARTFAEWGIEYFKYDFCHNDPLPTRAPLIEKISLISAAGGEAKEYGAGEALLEGGAAIERDAKLGTGYYIAGLSFGAGSATFTVDAPAAGTYILTIGMRKKYMVKKFLVVEVNGDKTYDTIVPAVWPMTAVDGRHQMTVELAAGENKLKFCNPIASRFDSAAYLYTRMGKALIQATEEVAAREGKPVKPITYSICEWGFRLPWKWGRGAGNLWRTTLDIRPNWAHILAIYEVNVHLAQYAGPGGFNDPDMLEVGNGGLNYEENKSHFTLWCMMNAPLLLGNDIRKFLNPDGTPDTQNEAYKVVTNREVIALDQDPLARQCRRISTNGFGDILVKDLAGGDAAICFLNKGSTTRLFSIPLERLKECEYLSLPDKEEYAVKELWTGTEGTVTETVHTTVAPHGVAVFRIYA
ncbi:MAG: alpha-galactosidase [Oscillospiraceae bacterium]|jgi:hypothetical protein|nr:alpha-galactosidase [Oscillospiraceae bacterium]